MEWRALTDPADVTSPSHKYKYRSHTTEPHVSNGSVNIYQVGQLGSSQELLYAYTCPYRLRARQLAGILLSIPELGEVVASIAPEQREMRC